MIIGPKFVCVGSHLYTLTMLSVAFSFFFRANTQRHTNRGLWFGFGENNEKNIFIYIFPEQEMSQNSLS